MRDGTSRLGPLTGVAFVVVGIVAFIVGGEPKSADEPVGEVVRFYLDNEDAVKISAALGLLAGTLLVFFGANLREALRSERSDLLPTVAFVGLVIVAVGIAIDGMIWFALADRADDISPAAVQALQALWDDDFLPIVLGVACFHLATGLAIVRGAPLPIWIGWLMLLLGVLAFTPVGFVSAIGAALLVLVLSILLTMRGGRPSTTPTAPTEPVT